MRIGEMISRLFMPKIKTIEQAKSIYINTYSGSRKNKFVLERWNEIYLPLIESAIAAGDADAFFKYITSDLMPCRGKAYDRAYEGLKIMLPKILTLKQAKELAYKAFPQSHRSDSSFPDYIKLRWEKISLAAVKELNTIEELRLVADDIYGHGEAFDVLISKWSEACTTVKQIKEVESCVYKEGYYSNSAINKVKRRTELILFNEIPKANDLDTIKYYYYAAPEESATKLFAFERWLEFCTRPEEADEAYKAAPKDKIACNVFAYNRAKQLALKSQ